VPRSWTRDAVESKAAILAEARLQFGQQGFERTTIRSIASAVGVDPALVMRYFVNKSGLFAAASELQIAFPDLSEVPVDQIGSVILPIFFDLWRPDGGFLALLRAAATSAEAAHVLGDIFAQQVAPRLGSVAVDHKQERAALIGSHLIGVAVARHIIGVPQLAAMNEEALCSWLSPVVTHYLSAPAPGR
jgi:AcrR family transcriptional regulator